MAVGGGNDDIRRHQQLGQLRQQRALAAELARELERVVEGAVGDGDAPHLFFRQVPRREFNRAAGADQQHPLLRQIGKNPSGQGDRGIGDRDRAGANRGFRAHLLGDGKGRLEGLGEGAANEFQLPRQGKGGFDLAENLGLAKHHRIEAGGNLHQMPHDLAILAAVTRLGKLVGGKAVEVRQPFERHAVPGGAVPSVLIREPQIHFGAVAGGDNHHAGHRGQPGGLPQRAGDPRGLESHPLAQGNVRGAVINASDSQLHRDPGFGPKKRKYTKV